MKNKKWKMPAVITLLGCLALPGIVRADFGFEEMEQMERFEQTELLEQARQAASSWSFSQAEDFLSRAIYKGYAPAEVAEVRKLIATNRDAKAEQERRHREAEEQRLAEEQREAERRRAQASSPSYSTSGSSGSRSFRCKSFCEGQFGASRGKLPVLTIKAGSLYDAEQRAKEHYIPMCKAYPFYSGGGGVASPGYVDCSSW